MKYLLPRKILTVTGFLMSGIMTVTTVITNENKDTITQTLGQATVKVVDKGDGKEDTEYYKSDYDNVGDLIDAGRKTAQQVLEEGTVLLKNDNHALPLKKGAKVSLVGVTGYDAVYGGTGSGTIDANEAINFSKSLSEDPSLAAAFSAPVAIRLIGRWTPMTPVDMTSVWSPE